MMDSLFEATDKIYKEILIPYNGLSQTQGLQLFGDLLRAKLSNNEDFFQFWYNFYCQRSCLITIEDNKYLYLDTRYYQLFVLQLINDDEYVDTLNKYLLGLREFIQVDKIEERDAIEKYLILTYLAGLPKPIGLQAGSNFDLLQSTNLDENKPKIIKTIKRRLKSACSLTYGFHYILLMVFLEQDIISLDLIKEKIHELNVIV